MRFFFFFFLLPVLLLGEAPSVIYLTWQHDPTSTMTIQWHTSEKEKLSQLSYQKKEETEWRQISGTVALFPSRSLAVHTVEITALEPDTTYRFQIDQDKKTYTFRTLPQQLSRPVHFVVGGDAYFYLYLLRKMNRQIARLDPDFIVVGGDIAYTQNNKSLFKGSNWEARRWHTFFQEWQKSMVGSDGRLIPLIPVIGNHDTKGSKSGLPFYYDLFAHPEKGIPYRALNFGNYLSLLLLDTGHTVPISGKQTSWLEKTLKASQQMPHKMAVYHIAAFPACYDFNGNTPTKIRNHWVPLFEQYQVQTAFEHHNHAYKRTHPIKNGKVDPSGVTYLGDGSWGVATRLPKNANAWYMAKAESRNAFWFMTLSEEGCLIESWDIDGVKIESLRR